MNKKYEATKAVFSLVKHNTIFDPYRWPPYCTGILHQLKRPMKPMEMKNASEKMESKFIQMDGEH